MCDPGFDREALTKKNLLVLRRGISLVSEIYDNMSKELEENPAPCATYILSYHKLLGQIDFAFKAAIDTAFEDLRRDMKPNDFAKLHKSWNKDLLRELNQMTDLNIGDLIERFRNEGDFDA